MRLAAAIVAALAMVPAASAARLVRVGNFSSPVYVTAAPGEPGIFVVEQEGQIQHLSGGRVTTFLDIRSRVLAEGERGLLSVAFHPDYAKNHLFYIDYVARNGNTVIAEYKGSAQRRVLANFGDPAPNHNGGQLVFGPDGYLWWGNGDGGGGGDEYGNGQRVTGNFAKIKRLNVSARTVAWKTWAIGLRNPWRFSFDRANGDLYIADVGQDKWEEIDYVPKGRSHLDFGWNRYEGRASFGDESLVPGWTYTPPVHVYGRNDGCSVTGGYVYRGKSVRAAVGRYYFGDYCSGKIWSFPAGHGSSVRKESINVSSLSSFGEDAKGELYLASLDGPVYRLAP